MLINSQGMSCRSIIYIDQAYIEGNWNRCRLGEWNIKSRVNKGVMSAVDPKQV